MQPVIMIVASDYKAFIMQAVGEDSEECCERRALTLRRQCAGGNKAGRTRPGAATAVEKSEAWEICNWGRERQRVVWQRAPTGVAEFVFIHALLRRCRPPPASLISTLLPSTAPTSPLPSPATPPATSNHPPRPLRSLAVSPPTPSPPRCRSTLNHSTQSIYIIHVLPLSVHHIPMASTFYSSFFSSGLLSQHSPRPLTPRPSSPTTPRAALTSLASDDTTPTAPVVAQDVFSTNESQVLPSISVASPAADGDSRPRLRRRRSSLAGAASPLATMKSSAPMRQAAASVQRQNLVRRARDGSDASILSTATASSVSSFCPNGPDSAFTATQRPTGFMGRLRSGSLGTALLR